MKIILLALVCLLISGCATSSQNQIEKIVYVEKPELILELPSPLVMEKPVTWTIINDKNYHEVIEKNKDENNQVFLVALDEKGYKNLAINNAKVLKYIREQKAIIAAYRNYYKQNKEIQP